MFDNGQVQMDNNGNVQVVPQSVEQSEMSQHSQQQMMNQDDEASNGF